MAVLLTFGAPSAVRAESPGYELRIAKSIELEVGQVGELPLSLVPQEGFRISQAGPLHIEVLVPAQITNKSGRMSLADAVDQKSVSPRFVLRLRAKEKGRFSLRLKIRFWLCRKGLCRAIRSERSIQVEARSGSEDPAPVEGSAL